MELLLGNNPFPDYVFPVEDEIYDVLWTIKPMNPNNEVDHCVYMNTSFHDLVIFRSHQLLYRLNLRYVPLRALGFHRQTWKEWIANGTTLDIAIHLSWCLNKDCTDLDMDELRFEFEEYFCFDRDPCIKIKLKQEKKKNP